MSELLRIWNATDLEGATPPSTFIIPNNPNARSLKINNQSRYWLLISKAQTGVTVDRIEPFSYLIIGYEPDLALSIDTTGDAVSVSSLNPDIQFVDYSVITGSGIIAKGSTVFSGEYNSQLSNQYIPTTQVYNNKVSVTFPAGATSATVNIPFLENGHMVELHRGFLFIVSQNAIGYTVTTMTANAAFVDGKVFTAPSSFSVTNESTNVWSYGGRPAICNSFNVTLTCPTANPNADTVTVYFQIDANDTAVDVQPGTGIPVQPTGANLLDASGTITTANTSQNVIGAALAPRKYLFFQNLSSADMYINLANTATTGSGSIYIQPNGGAITFESGFCPQDQLNVICATAGSAYTCKFA